MPASLTVPAVTQRSVDLQPTSLSAAVVDPDRRIIRGLIVPWGVAGLTSAGPLKVRRGSLELPADPGRVKLFLDHALGGIGAPGRSVVGHALSFDDTPEGLQAAFRIVDGPDGDRALLEAGPHNRSRDGLSIEAVNLLLVDDEVVAGRLVGTALVPIPAFVDSRVSSVAAALQTQPEGSAMPPLELQSADPITQPFSINFTPDEAAASTDSPAAVEASTSQAAELAASVGGPAGAAPARQAAAPAGLPSRQSRPSAALGTLQQFYAAISARHTGQITPELTAALADITQTSVGADMTQPQWVGELWDGVQYQRKVVPLLGGAKPLTSYKVNGWKWTTKPEVDTYTGDKAAVPSNAVGTDPFTTTAARLAGAHDIDRALVDFGDTGFIQAYYEAMAESYARKSDAKLLAAIIAGATDEATPAYEGFLGAIAAGVAAIDDETGAGSTFVLVNKADLIPFVLATTTFDMPAMLQSIGVDLDRIVTHGDVTAGHVIVGTSAAMDYYELPGSPIRVEAVDLTKGGVDAGAFGYYATVLHDAAGIVDVVIDTGA